MNWLNYSDHEVTVFHPEFETAANEVLQNISLDSQYRWDHHLRLTGEQLIPDFVLVEIATNRWILIVEIKRTQAAVYSTRNQVQTKGYAEANKTRFIPGRPQYFVISNLESTFLFAINGSNPPRDCRVKDMSFVSGSFIQENRDTHRENFKNHLGVMIEYIIATPDPKFESLWPRISQSMLDYSTKVPYNDSIDLRSGAVPRVVSEYFAGDYTIVAKRELLLRCLAVEYLHGILNRFHHQYSSRIPAIREDVRQIANSIDALRTIDFSGVFEPESAELYRRLYNETEFKTIVERYLTTLISERIYIQAEQRGDSLEFPETLTSVVYPIDIQERNGKIQTDPDLAFLLASLAINHKDSIVLDPGCGDGNLLTAAYDVLRSYKLSHSQALEQIMGIEADPFAAKITSIRLALKEPFVLDASDANHIICRDMFSSPDILNTADVILMNPPFKRFEAQDPTPIPSDLRQHYIDQIVVISGDVRTEGRQSNIYNLYVEYILKACKKGTSFGIILDNRWYHNKSSSALRGLILDLCEIVAVAEYPHDSYFRDWTIATSILIARKRRFSPDHKVLFIRTNDPRRADFTTISNAVQGKVKFPTGWRVNEISQSNLDDGSWKHYFSKDLENEFRLDTWPNLDALFEFSRRGSLDKEGGGISVFEFPFNQTSYGPKRRIKPIPKSRYQTLAGEGLTNLEENQVRDTANNISENFRGYALRNADVPSGFSLTIEDVNQDQTIEAPLQRTDQVKPDYFLKRRMVWNTQLDSVVDQIINDPFAGEYVRKINTVVGLNETVLPRLELWNVLREPYAGELIIPRMLRVGHRVHINPFAYDQNGRQVRLSSNLFSYSKCIAIDPTLNLPRETAVMLIAAFLLSSFGQLQFEFEATNREGGRKIEQHQLEKIRIFDPRWVRMDKREAILATMEQLPYPIPTDRPPYVQTELVALDELFADEIAFRNPNLDKNLLITEVHQRLFECIEDRRP